MFWSQTTPHRVTHTIACEPVDKKNLACVNTCYQFSKLFLLFLKKWPVSHNVPSPTEPNPIMLNLHIWINKQAKYLGKRKTSAPTHTSTKK